MDDIVQRLRDAVTSADSIIGMRRHLCSGAADEIERLRDAITNAAEAVEYGHARSKVSTILREAYTPQ